MMKIGLALLLILTNLAWAEDSCDVKLHKGLRITNDSIEVIDKDRTLYKIINDQQLWISGRELPLDANQQATVSEYSKNLRQMVPQVRFLALDAVDISTGVVLAMFDEVADPGSNSRKKILSEFSAIKADIEKKYAQGKPVYFNEKNDNDQIISQEFEPHLAAIVENAGEDFASGLLKKVGGILFSPDSAAAFDASMQEFGKKMEKEMAVRTQALAQHASVFCASAKALDEQEALLQRSVKELGAIDLFTISESGRGQNSSTNKKDI